MEPGMTHLRVQGVPSTPYGILRKQKATGYKSRPQRADHRGEAVFKCPLLALRDVGSVSSEQYNSSGKKNECLI